MTRVENHLNKPLPHHVQYVLRYLFADYATVAVTQEIEQPADSGWLYQAQPASQDGEADRLCLAKVDRCERIAQEWQAYLDCIQHKLTPVAEIVGEPIYPPGSSYGGLRYTLVGNGEEEIESLEEFYRRASAEEMQTLLRNRLFASLGYLWRQQKSQPACYLRRQYDSLLPVNLEIVVAAPTGNAHWLSPQTVDDPPPQVGGFVQVADFCVVGIDEAAQTLLLDLPGSPPGGYRLRALGVTDCAAYEIGRTFNAPLVGQALRDRAGMLMAAAQAALGVEADLRGDTLPLADGDDLPNPLAALDDILQQSRPLFLGFQHGDLRLANVLVARQSQTPYLTQFAQARRDHVLGDLCCLEADVVMRLLPADMAPEQLRELYRQLHCAVNQPKQMTSPPGLEKQFALLQTIRQTAVYYLYKPGDWAEYYSSLFVYLLRGLTAQELPLPMQRLAFWGAAVVAAIRRDPPICNLAAPPRGGVIGVTPPILLQPGEPVIQLGQHYCQWFLNRVQIAYHGVVWQQTPQVTVNSRVALHCPPLPDPAARAEAERPVQPGQTEQIGVNARLTDLTPAMMTNMLLAVDLVGAEARQTILSLVGDFQLLAGLRPGTYAILGTVDAARPLPDAEMLKRLELRQGSLWLDDKPVTDYSYVLLEVTAYGARTRVLARGTAWDEKLREAEILVSEAESGLLDEAERIEAKQRWKDLLREARRLLAADPHYLPREADDIYKQAATGSDKFGGQRGPRGLRGHQGASDVPPDVLNDLTELGLDAEEDIAATLTRYAQQAAETRRALRQAEIR